MNQEQFGQFWEQLKAKWTDISDVDLIKVKGDLRTFGTVLQKRYGELRKDEVLIWARRRYTHWSRNYIGYQEKPSAV